MGDGDGEVEDGRLFIGFLPKEFVPDFFSGDFAKIQNCRS